MNAVVDTNVVAYFVLGTDRFVDEARTFIAALDEAWAPAVWEAELANVLWMATRPNVLSIDAAARGPTRATGWDVHAVPNRRLLQGHRVGPHQSEPAAHTPR